MLLVLGMYDAMLLAITKFDVIYIGILGYLLIGVFLITKPIEWIMNKYPHQTYCDYWICTLPYFGDIWEKILP